MTLAKTFQFRPSDVDIADGVNVNFDDVVKYVNDTFGTESLATTATTGFLYVPSCAGTPTGTPTGITGRVAMVVDSTNNKLYFYSGGAWRDAGP